MKHLLPADVLDRLLIERTRERDLARDIAVALEDELAAVTDQRDYADATLVVLGAFLAQRAWRKPPSPWPDAEIVDDPHPVGVPLRTQGADWVDPVPRVVEDPGIRCACGGCDWIDGTHSADHCVPPEANDE